MLYPTLGYRVQGRRVQALIDIPIDTLRTTRASVDADLATLAHPPAG